MRKAEIVLPWFAGILAIATNTALSHLNSYKFIGGLLAYSVFYVAYVLIFYKKLGEKV